MLFIALIAALALWFTPPANAFQLGIEDDAVLIDGNHGDSSTTLDQGHQMGATVVRFIIDPSRVKYSWTAIDSAVDLARSKGYRIWMTLGWPPWEWHWGARNFSNFAMVAATHLRGRVSDYTLVNEPDYIGMQPKLYHTVFVFGRRAIQRIDPTARVYLGELSGIHPIPYMRAVLVFGPLRAEGFAWHPYQFVRPPESNGGRKDSIGIGRINRMAKFLRTNTRDLSNANGKPLGMYLTEFGYLTRGRNSIPERKAAAWWPRAMKQAKRHRVRLLVAYQMSARRGSVGPWDSSLIDSDGNPRPAFWAIQQAEGLR